MQEQWINSNLVNMLLGIIAVILLVQAYVLIRIRNLLQAIAINFDSIMHYWRKLASYHTSDAAQQTTLKTCQFCKHRLAYINTARSKEGEDDFYHRCGVRNIYVRLEDSCPRFEKEAQ